MKCLLLTFSFGNKILIAQFFLLPVSYFLTKSAKNWNVSSTFIANVSVTVSAANCYAIARESKNYVVKDKFLKILIFSRMSKSWQLTF